MCGGNDRWLSVSVPSGNALVIDATNAQKASVFLFGITGGCAEQNAQLATLFVGLS